MRRDTLPTYWELTPAVLRTLADAGGSLTRQELKDRAPAVAGLTEEQLSVLFEDGQWAGTSVVVGRMGWALSALKGIGAVDNSDRGVWSITAAGRAFLAQGAEAVVRACREGHSARRRARAAAAAAPDVGQTSAEEELADDGPREFGCRDVQVTSYSDDEGIDGVGVLEVSLLSFPVFFQAKRYRQDRAIQPSTVRHRLCELLRDKQLGVVLRPVVDTSFFDAL